jgi:hypothetical protein
MPTQLRLEIAASPAPETIAVHEITVTRMEHGKVTPADLKVPFTDGMQIVDVIKGVTYWVDAQGEQVGAAKPLLGVVPPDAAKRAPPESGFSWRQLVIWLNVALLVFLVVAVVIKKRKQANP